VSNLDAVPEQKLGTSTHLLSHSSGSLRPAPIVAADCAMQMRSASFSRSLSPVPARRADPCTSFIPPQLPPNSTPRLDRDARDGGGRALARETKAEGLEVDDIISFPRWRRRGARPKLLMTAEG